MSIIEVFLAFFYALYGLAYAIPLCFIAFCLWRAFSAAVGGRGRSAIPWVVLASAPFLLFLLDGVRVDSKIAARKQHLAALPRVALNGRYPDTMVVQGYLGDSQIAALLYKYGFSRIYMNQTRGRWAPAVFTPSPSIACSMSVERWVRRRLSNTRGIDHALEKELAGCLSRSRLPVPDPRRDGDAVVVLMDHAATLHQGNTVYGGTTLEIRLHESGSSQLVDYAERQHIERQASHCASRSQPSVAIRPSTTKREIRISSSS